MNQKYIKIIPFLMAGALLFAGCGAMKTEETVSESTAAVAVSTDPENVSAEIESETAVTITLEGTSAKADSDAVSISGQTVTITKGGTYYISGSLDNGSVIIDADKEEKVQLVLNGVSINADDFAAIYAASADEVSVTLADGTTNTLSNGGSFTAIDENNVDAVIFSKDDLTLKGTGTLKISAPAGHAIVGKDDVEIKDGSYEISAGGDGIHANEVLQIDGGTFVITAAEGLEATHVTINDGEISIEASDDGINASQKSDVLSPVIEINGGSTTIVMGEGDTDGVDSNGDIVINGGTISVNGNSTFDYDGTGVINGGTVIVNGEQVTTLPNQMMGGPEGTGGPGGMGDPGSMGNPGEMGDPGEMGGFGPMGGR